MYLCDITKDISCGGCPFKDYGECGEYSTKKEIVQELEDISR